jgi:uncharacterized protein HemX
MAASEQFAFIRENPRLQLQLSAAICGSKLCG